jgi:hypothetical protein
LLGIDAKALQLPKRSQLVAGLVGMGCIENVERCVRALPLDF